MLQKVRNVYKPRNGTKESKRILRKIVKIFIIVNFDQYVRSVNVFQQTASMYLMNEMKGRTNRKR